MKKPGHNPGDSTNREGRGSDFNGERNTIKIIVQ